MRNIILAMLVFCGIPFSPAFTNAQEMFEPPILYDSGAYPYSVSTGDFNNDGNLDLAVANRYWHKVSVIINNGDNTFSAPVSYPVGRDPLFVATEDFNRDGYLDMAVASHYSSTVSVLINNGDGTFAAAVGYTVGAYQFSALSGDFNGDNYPDLAVTNFYYNTVSVLMNNGDGTFGTAVKYSVPAVPAVVVTEDFNGDDKLDLAVAIYSSYGKIAVLLNNGDGTFSAAAYYDTGLYPRYVVAEDFNKDGKPDLATINTHYESTVSVFINNGDGTFAAAVNYSAGIYATCTVAGDFNKDGWPDLAVSNYHPEDIILILINNGDGTFYMADSYSTGGADPSCVTVGDFNGDDKLDLAVVNYTSNTGSILLNCLSNTQPGEDVVITDPETGTSLIFDSVIEGGETTVTMADTAGGGVPGPPEGFRIMPEGWYYEISTTAVFEGNITIGIEYDDAGLNLKQEEKLSLWHFSNGWTNITSSVDTLNNIIYGITDSLSYFMVTSGMTAVVDIDPNTLNLKSKGNYITCYIELPASYSLDMINADTVVISREGYWPLAAEPSPRSLGDYDGDGVADLMVKFSRPGVYALFSSTVLGCIELLVDGSLTSAGSPYFSGVATVNVIDKGKEHCDEADPSSVVY